MAAAAATSNGFPVLSTQAYLDGKPVRETRTLVADLCRQFYTLGWVSGTGGSITIKVHDDSIPKKDQLIVMSPSGVQKERMIPEDIIISCYLPFWRALLLPYPGVTDIKLAYQMRNAGAVIHSHGMESCLVTMINPLSKEFRITHMEMIKGVQGHGYHDELVVPIIENTAHERELTESLTEAISAYPKATAVLVRNHGIYVWGDSWISAKTQAECYHYLFDAAIKLHQLGIDWTSPSHGLIQNKLYQGGIKRNFDVYASAELSVPASMPSMKCILLDIEGTTTPISFVTEVLFPYASQNVRKHLMSTYDSEETKDDIKLFVLNLSPSWLGKSFQVHDDLQKGVSGSLPIPPDDAGKEQVIDSLVANVEAMIKADRKITALKQLQGHVWRTGYDKKELKGVVFDDVPEALERWYDSGVKVYIYSSGSREAQRLIFGNTEYGDLRKYLCGYFDTTVGNKREERSYFEIYQYVGVDKPSQILFITDVYQEAVAAKAAGLEVIISVRTGNAPLPENHGFKTITSFAEI
ncbi:hypothetical protein HPP92_019811 [Vanilla planifolia]|uniref:Probable bifunctional methylthioribulose-1-phosphate dehydratase/enolase-phosphatase E1 n=1 Tax=Vanilla planifolia TaxID=51239 RepID=A0A835QAD0_VANPL|nr:hypothetical protein HPP92_019811 [Vanilla planifolia]